MKIKSITFELENCDDITISGKYIGDFAVSDIRTRISRCAANSIRRLDVCHEFFIEISAEANELYQEFGQTGERYSRMKFNRLKCRDITAIYFDLVEAYPQDEEDPKTEHYSYSLNWTGDSDYVNDAQKNYESSLGNLYIAVSEDKKVTDYFDVFDVNNKDLMGYKFEMYDIGKD